MKTALFLLLSASIQVAVVHAQPQCAFTIDDAPGNSDGKRRAEFSLPPGAANSANELKVCAPNSPGGGKTFKVVRSTGYGPAGGQPYESWVGESSDGSTLSFVVDHLPIGWSGEASGLWFLPLYCGVTARTCLNLII